MPEKRVSEDISRLAPGALRTGVEAIPGGPGETSKIAPGIARGVINEMVRRGWINPDTAQEFEQGYEATGAQYLPDMGTVQKYITDPILGSSEDVQAQTGPGRYFKTMIEEAPSAVLNPGSKVSKIMQWLAGSLGSEGAGQLAESYADQLPSWGEGAARMAGGALGSTAPQTFNKASNPNPIPPFRQPSVDILKARNVPISAGQMTGSKKLLMKEDVAGDIPAWDQQGDAYTKAVLGEQGGFPRGTERATRPVMKAELNRMGSEFDRLEALSAVPFDQQLQDDLLGVVQDYIENNPTVAPVVEARMTDLAKNAAVNNGVITGEGYKNFRTKINALIGSENTDPGVTGALMDMKDKLDDAIGRTLPANEQSAWRKVRAEYRNYLPIERAKAAPGRQAAEGVINPKPLKTGVKAIEGRREIASGERPMTDLAEAGETVLEKPQSSGTAERARSQLAQLIATIGAGAGGTIGAALQGGPAAIALGALGAAGGIGYPMARDAFVRSDAGQRILGRQGPRIDTGTTTPVPDVRFPTGNPIVRDVGNPTAQALMEFIRQSAMQAEREQGDRSRR
jgi:hypothetical protein